MYIYNNICIILILNNNIFKKISYDYSLSHTITYVSDSLYI